MLALTLASLLRRELHHKGIDLSIPTLLDELSKIHKVALLYPAEAGVKNQLALSEIVTDPAEALRGVGIGRVPSA